ncbi:hypothetical protein [Frigoribacterium faeni]|uniref:Ferredoxin-NADP reductase n=1 Tax=Frigoribacterium faeni TaxID=145483 RepID=A0A7W3PK44_9MICO|nr:hypothetical protein [Frigoribacterium faeni]MBA8814571.1 ferredoxin-NADP reductase [Frigoribacterium faeni]GEK84681.1 hypothetical protein FFA01_29900 [Frigoribacterium faeni]
MTPAADPFDWLPGTVVAVSSQTARARSLTIAVPGLREARAGQHVDLRLTADDGYTAVRSYSLSDVRGSRAAHGGRDLDSAGGAGRVGEDGSVRVSAGGAGRVGEDGSVRVSAGGAGRVGDAGIPSIEVTVERMVDGEVSPYLVEDAEPGDPIEVRGPIGGWFVWPPTEFEPDSAVHAVLPEPPGATPLRAAPVQLIGGGSGVAPLMAMVRARGRDAPPFRLLASVRDPRSRWFAGELDEAVRASSGMGGDSVAGAATGGDSVAGAGGDSAAGAGAGGRSVAGAGADLDGAAATRAGASDDADPGAGGALGAEAALRVDWVYSREAPEGEARPAGRLTRDELERFVLPASAHPLVYVCGANSFVEAVAAWLVELGHAPTRVRTERFGGL